MDVLEQHARKEHSYRFVCSVHNTVLQSSYLDTHKLRRDESSSLSLSLSFSVQPDCRLERCDGHTRPAIHPYELGARRIALSVWLFNVSRTEKALASDSKNLSTRS
jgi:hypothetical protein